MATSDGNKRRTIVVGVDGSKGSQAALRWAAAEAEATHASLRVIMTWHISGFAYSGGLPLPSDIDFAGAAQQALDNEIREVIGTSPPFPLTATVLEGLPAQVLIDAAADADLLVVGSRGHGEFAGMLLGSVSQHCVSHASCPVVVVRNGGTF
jgi:nucleotide-binding universal stress UspA family protein